MGIYLYAATYNPPPPLPPTHSPLLREAVASLLRKVDTYVVDPIVERQLAARVRRIEDTLDREHELRIYGGHQLAFFSAPRITATAQ